MKKKSITQTFGIAQARTLNSGALIFLLLLLVVSPAATASAPSKGEIAEQANDRTIPPEGDGNGIIVRLDLPWTVLLKRENLTFYYILENHSGASIPVAFPFGKPFGWPNGGQAFLEGILVPGSPEPGGVYSEVDVPWLKVNESSWPPLDEEQKVVDVWGELPASQRVIWNRNRLRARESFRVHSTEHLRAIQAHWLVGKGKWVSSEPIAVEVREVPVSLWTQVFEGEWSSYGRGLDSRVTRVMKIPLDGKWFLFSDFMCRICEVRESDEFDFELDPVIGQLAVTVKSTAGESTHYYHMQHGLTRDIPWTAGPVSQYYPVPEPIPAEDLARITNAGRGHTSTTEPVEASADSESRHWLWWLLVPALSCGALVFFAARRKNEAPPPITRSPKKIDSP